MLEIRNRVYNSPVTLDNLERVKQYLGKLSKDRFYGVVELQFQDGELILIRKQESIKPGFLVIME